MAKKSKSIKIELNNNGDKIIINDDCTKCGVCVEECPVDAIFEGILTMEVDETKCIMCRWCTKVCPIDQIDTKELVFNNLMHRIKDKYWYA